MSPARDRGAARVVAELGRPETPQETADRRAAASAKRRANQTTFNLVIALVASLAIVAFLILVVVRADAPTRGAVDYVAIAADAQPSVDVPLVVPVLPEAWSANRAEISRGQDVTAWEIGLLTPDSEYIEITQGIAANPTWVREQVREGPATGEVELGGLTWTTYDRRDVEDPGNVAFALVTEAAGSTYVLSGTAPDEEFAAVATAVAADIEEETP